MSDQCPPYMRAMVHSTVKAVNQEQREILHLISTGSIDRAGDIVEPGGVDLRNYLRNPIVLVDHDYRTEKIIGKAVHVEINDDGIWARTQFRDTPLARDAFNLAKESLGGWSVGFRPIEHESIRDDKGKTRGFRFKKWELLEYSQVAIPMNPDIVQNCIQRGLVHQEHVALFMTEEEAKPAQTAAPGPTVEPDLEPVAAILRDACRQLERHEAARAIERSIRNAG